jgi:hypothetical protein
MLAGKECAKLYRRVHDVLIMEPSDALHTLATFRHSFYDECLHRRADALFELTDALLTADTVPSPVHLLSLEALHRRGWGSLLYAALDRGQIGTEALQGLLVVRHPLAGSGTTPVYAVWT